MRVQELMLPDGAHTAVEWFGEDSAQTKGLMIFLPALGVAMDYYRPLAQAWAQLGYRVVSVEMRGMRQSSVRNVKQENFGYKEVLTVDLPALLSALQREAADRPCYVAGHSLGGQFALLYASRYPTGVSGVIAVASGSNYYGSMPTGLMRYRRYCGIRIVQLINAALGYFPGDTLGFGGRQPRNMIRDWTHEGLTGNYRVTGDTTDYNAAIARLELPVLFLSLSGDPLVPCSCADFLASKLARARVTQVELQAHDYGLPAFHHFRWVRNPDPILAHIDQWVEGVSGQAQQNPAVTDK